MAVSTVSSLTTEPWQLISTTTPSVTTSISITVPSGYKTLMLSWNGVRFGVGTDNAALTFNSNTSNYAGGGNSYISAAGSRNSVKFTGNAYNDQDMDGNVIITNINVAAPKIVSGFANMAGTQNWSVNSSWNDEATVTSVQFRCNDGSATFKNATGTIKLYGIAG